MKITLYNDFHGTEAVVIPQKVAGQLVLSGRQVRRAYRKLCGIDECHCSNAIGIRGPQDVSVEVLDRSYNNPDGGAILTIEKTDGGL